MAWIEHGGGTDEPPAKQIPYDCLACPFCFSDGVSVERDQRSYDFYVECANCGAMGPPRRKRADAVTAWDVAPRPVPTPMITLKDVIELAAKLGAAVTFKARSE